MRSRPLQPWPSPQHRLDPTAKKRFHRVGVRITHILELGAVTFLVLVLAGGVSAQRGDAIRLKPDSTAKLPPLSMTCPMHPDIIESKPGSCPLCKMSLVPVRLDTSWMCPIHTHVMPGKPGSCPLCGRSLVEARVAVTWTCAAQPGISRLEPGACPDGTPTRERRTLRPHGNHNPQHGGQFFMAADNWHHVEGTYPRAGVFRLYVYDDYARPLSAANLRKVAARVVTDERYDPKTRTSTDLKAFPLRPSRDGAYLEARVSGDEFAIAGSSPPGRLAAVDALAAQDAASGEVRVVLVSRAALAETRVDLSIAGRAVASAKATFVRAVALDSTRVEGTDPTVWREEHAVAPDASGRVSIALPAAALAVVRLEPR